jgi:hypothetical protein
MGALDKVVAKVKKELDLPNYKFKVVVSLPYAYVNNTKAFGDINGDGVTEYIKNLDDKKAVYEWYTSYILETFNKKVTRTWSLVVSIGFMNQYHTLRMAETSKS